MKSKLTHFIGIDVSKMSFDAAWVCDKNPTIIHHEKFDKDEQSFEKFLGWLQLYDLDFNENTIVCLEQTGIYTHALIEFLLSKGAQVWLAMPYDIKHSGGLQRGKNDKIDAKRIAVYAMRNADKAQLYELPQDSTQKLQYLLSQRDRLVEGLKRLQVPVEEMKQEGLKEQSKELEKDIKPAINGIKKSIINITDAIDKIIHDNAGVTKQIEQLTTIPGIGLITALSLVVYTDGFKRLKNAKQLACYCGVVPFGRSSGKSIRGKEQISFMANRKLKTLLHLGSLAAVRTDVELRTYYERKLKEGKNKMSVLNAVRNKLVHRAVAVIRDERPYIKRVA
jgi:transposase